MMFIGSGAAFMTRSMSRGGNVSHLVDLLKEEICLSRAGPEVRARTINDPACRRSN
jgi:hypothetical protein